MIHVTLYLRRMVLALFALVLLGGVAYAQPKFDFRAVNLIDGLANADLYINDTPPAAATIAYEWSTPLVKYPASTVGLKFAPTGSPIGSSVVGTSLNAAANVAYTAIAYGTSSQAKLKVLERPREQRPPANMALLRVFDAATLPGTYDVYLASTDSAAIFTGVATDMATTFATVNGEGASLIVTPAGQKTPLARFTVPLAPNSVTTLIITGSTPTNLKVYALDADNVEGYKLPLLKAVQGGTGLPSAIRVINTWRQKNTLGTGMQALDAYIDGVLKSHDLRYRVASEKFGPYAGDSATVKFTPLNEGSTDIFTRGFRMHTDTDYTVVLTRNSQGAANTLLLATPNAIPGTAADSLFVRIANVSAASQNAHVKLYAPASSGTPVFDTTVAYLTRTRFVTIGRATDFKLEVYRGGATSPSLTRTEPLGHASAYMTYILSGDDTSLTADLLDESLVSRQVFDPASSVPYDLPGATAALRLRNVPNPFVASTSINFTLPRAGQVSIVLFDALGRQVRSLLDEHLEAGDQHVIVDAGDLSSGSYIYRLDIDGEMQGAGRMVLVR